MSHLLRRFDLPTLSLLPAGEPFGGGLRESLAEIEGWTPAGVGREISDEAFLVTLATGLNAAADGERGSDGGTISMSAATSSSTSVDRYSVRKSAPSARIGSVCVNRNVLCARSRRTTRSRNPSARLRTSKPCFRNSVLMAHPLQWAAIIVSAFTILCHLSMAFFLMYSAPVTRPYVSCCVQDSSTALRSDLRRTPSLAAPAVHRARARRAWQARFSGQNLA